MDSRSERLVGCLWGDVITAPLRPGKLCKFWVGFFRRIDQLESPLVTTRSDFRYKSSKLACKLQAMFTIIVSAAIRQGTHTLAGQEPTTFIAFFKLRSLKILFSSMPPGCMRSFVATACHMYIFRLKTFRQIFCDFLQFCYRIERIILYVLHVFSYISCYSWHPFTWFTTSFALVSSFS